MKKIPDIIKPIFIDCIGENTKQKYTGHFRVKVLLTNAERFKVDRTYSTLLPDDKSVDQASKIKAEAIAQLDERVVEAPKWWTDSRGGRDLLDSQPIWDLMIAVNEKFTEWQQELEKEATEENNVN